MRLTTLGDLLLDVIVRLEQPLVPGDDQVAVTRSGAGGQAANVAAWAAALGAEARFVGRRGDDAAAEIVTRALRGHGVEVAGPAGGRTGRTRELARVQGGGGERVAEQRVAGDVQHVAIEPRRLELVRRQIGRASCRERV